MTISVRGCRILLKPFKIQENDKIFAAAKSAGIVIPELSERKEQSLIEKGTIIQIGDSCHKDYVEGLKPGDVIGFAKFGGKFVQDKDDTLFLIINDEDVICVYE